MRRVLWTAAALVVAAWIFSLVEVVAAARRENAGPADAIVVMGAAQYNGRPSPVFKARLDHAAALFRRHLAPRLIVAGGTGSGDTVSEADVGRRYLLAPGIDTAAIVAIGTGRATEPALRAAADWIRAHRGRRVILVSDGFHMLRLSLIARRLGLLPLSSPARTSPIASNRRLEITYLLAESIKAPVAFLLTR
ncbi:MAG TPA: YdcF family protein [Gemmatimonadales bacterium]|nr:YdcF family protein [Gemmatimonadales bacterium]